MDGPTDGHALSTMTNIEFLSPLGCYCPGNMTYQKRLNVIKTAKSLVDRAGYISYCKGGVLFPLNWDDSIDGVGELRCDGLVEVCYEINGLRAWGKLSGNSTHFDIRVDAYQAEHNEQNQLPMFWKRHLAPATQCGNVGYGYEGKYWNTNLRPQNLCEPIGNKGGWE